ncbi:uncharacterized protein DC041_0010861 [Schistosoma bovis]|uniref:Uncharacterized protein n=1 Tax=Schistosoma bovis TaxID=6184 RepID=A0A430Q383_SCHBO|nr:uncharacterized protein DC041_0010861 [Schistosoma bovis]
MESKLKEKQQSNSLIIDENELKEYKSTAKQYDSIPIEEKTNILKLKISSLKKIKDDQSIQLDQLTSMKTNEDKKLLLQNAQLQAKLNNLRKELMNQQQTSIESTKNQVKAELQIEQLINSIRTELFDIRNEAQAQRFEIENQRNELMKKSKALNHELSLLSSRLTNSNQLEPLTTNTTRTSRKEEGAAAAASDDEDDEKIQQIIKLFRDHFMVHINEFENKVTTLNHELSLLSSRLTNSNQLEPLTTNTTRTSRKEEGAAAAASDDEDDEKIQQIIKLFRDHFMVHINEFENKVTSITERLNLEVNQMQTFKIYANSLIEKINATESKQKSLLLTDHNNQRILKHLDISNAIRNKMQQFIEDSRKKKRALCLRIVLLKRKLNFFEYEVEKLRKENNNLK